MSYLINENFNINVGFNLTANQVLNAVSEANQFLSTLPETLYKSIDYKTTGSLIGSVFCEKLADSSPDAAVNPIEKGHPDIIPSSGLGSSEEILRNYPQGMEVKGTIGNVKQGSNLRAGQKRISELSGITWQAHHREVNHLLGFVWDFAFEKNGFLFPKIIGVFYSDNLTPDDWGEISGTTGRNTKVSGMIKSGKEKMGNGWVVLLNQDDYKNKLSSFLYFNPD